MPRVATLRTNTLSASETSVIRIRSPSRAPPETTLVGSTDSTAARWTVPYCSANLPISVDLPAPGGPEIPTNWARPAWGSRTPSNVSKPSARRSTQVRARASERMSPFRRPSAKCSGLVGPAAVVIRRGPAPPESSPPFPRWWCRARKSRPPPRPAWRADPPPE